MREVLVHQELAAAFRAAGHWVAKWPDQAAYRGGHGGAAHGQDGKVRFSVPKPCDLVGCLAPTGRFVAVEAKLIQTRMFRTDARLVRQVGTLRDLAARGAWVAFALNFRYQARRPTPARVNRLFLLDPALDALGQERARWAVEDAEVLGVELTRIPGGWSLAPTWTVSDQGVITTHESRRPA
jgi:hypothetical protein